MCHVTLQVISVARPSATCTGAAGRLAAEVVWRSSRVSGNWCSEPSLLCTSLSPPVFSDVDFSDASVLSSLINENRYESQILQVRIQL